MKNITISTKQALASLQETNLIKVLKHEDGVTGLCVRYLPREEAVRLISENTCEDVGDNAKAKGFGMSFQNGEDVYFIESKSHD